MPLAIDSIYVHQPVNEADFPLRPVAPNDHPPVAMAEPVQCHIWPVAAQQPAPVVPVSLSRVVSPGMLLFCFLFGLCVIVEVFV